MQYQHMFCHVPWCTSHGAPWRSNIKSPAGGETLLPPIEPRTREHRAPGPHDTPASAHGVPALGVCFETRELEATWRKRDGNASSQPVRKPPTYGEGGSEGEGEGARQGGGALTICLQCVHSVHTLYMANLYVHSVYTTRSVPATTHHCVAVRGKLLHVGATMYCSA